MVFEDCVADVQRLSVRNARRRDQLFGGIFAGAHLVGGRKVQFVLLATVCIGGGGEGMKLTKEIINGEYLWQKGNMWIGNC